MSSAFAVQTKGVGSAFHLAMKSKIASIKSGTLAKLPRRTALPLSSANQRSTKVEPTGTGRNVMNFEAPMTLQKAAYLLMFVRTVIVHDQVQFDIGLKFSIELA